MFCGRFDVSEAAADPWRATLMYGLIVNLLVQNQRERKKPQRTDELHVNIQDITIPHVCAQNLSYSSTVLLPLFFHVGGTNAAVTDASVNPLR